jgi:hypothetical protein
MECKHVSKNLFLSAFCLLAFHQSVRVKLSPNPFFLSFCLPSHSFYQNDYGPAFLEALDSFDTYRKDYSIGTDGWLTVSMSARDWNKDGMLEREPNVSIIDINNRRALQLDASEDHTSGVILRNTRPLPDEYRIEYKLMTYDFGGKKEGNIEYDGKVNGYKAEGPVYPCKTQVGSSYKTFVPLV